MDAHFISDVTLPGTGTVTGVFWNRDRTIMAVSSIFRLLTEPPARAAYGGRYPRQRVALYRPPATRPFAVFDDAAHAINAVAFHPTRPVVLLGCGSYDGGYRFEGQLLLWDWSTSSARDLGSIPDVIRVEFAPDGNSGRATVRPWDEGFAEEKGGEAFDMFFEIELQGLFERASFEGDIQVQLDALAPRTVSDFLIADPPDSKPPERQISKALGVSYRRRSPIWDIALSETATVDVVHDDCLLEQFGLDGSLKRSLTGAGHGVEILRSAVDTFVHIVRVDNGAEDWHLGFPTKLARLHDGELTDVLSLLGRFTFSIRQDGSILGRCDRSFGTGAAALDVIVADPMRVAAKRYDLGHYDVFNHFLRIDGAPVLFCVLGTPKESPERKFLCTVALDGKVERLWPLLRDLGDQASHAMECCYEYIADGLGAGIIASGKHYDSSPRTPFRGFVYRKNLNGRELWRHQTTSVATSIKATRDSRIVLIAFLDGDFAVLHADTGDVVSWDLFKPSGTPTVIVSIAVGDTHVALGTLDGRIGLASLSTLTP